VGFVIAILLGLTRRPADRSARHGLRSAPESFPLMLGKEIADASFFEKHGGYLATHNPTHKKYVLHELPRTLAVPAVL
jgi:hypothetical protein